MAFPLTTFCFPDATNIKCFVSWVKAALKSSPTMHSHVGPYFSSHCLLIMALTSRSCLVLQTRARDEKVTEEGAEAGQIKTERGKAKYADRERRDKGVWRGFQKQHRQQGQKGPLVKEVLKEWVERGQQTKPPKAPSVHQSQEEWEKHTCRSIESKTNPMSSSASFMRSRISPLSLPYSSMSVMSLRIPWDMG